jgi:hypothetical protein
MGMVTGGSVRRRDSSQQLPPGQYLTDDFPVLSRQGRRLEFPWRPGSSP